MKVTNMRSPRSYNRVANQFEIEGDDGSIYFQSYNTVIAKKIKGQIYLDENAWDCSATTGKYRNIFLGEGKKETQAKINSGEYKLTNLN